MNLKKTALTLGLAVFAVGATAASAFAASAYATGSVNVRNGPSTNYRVVDQLHRGEVVDVEACRSGWCLIHKPGPDGWVRASYLAAGHGRYDDDDYYDDGPDFYISNPRPHRRHDDYYDHYYPRPGASFCVGGQNASFCLNGY